MTPFIKKLLEASLEGEIENHLSNEDIEEFGNMCKDTVYNYLKKVNYRYKKNFSLSRKG
ncbi:putative transposase [Wolbachia endosymbiont of Cylisticus convexus]|nr:putative transposase [Wolbachia endosymbiont of Cylisticus convexus]